MKIINSTDEKLLNTLFSRSQLDCASETASVIDILENVRKKGDSALYEYTQKYDGADLKKCGLMVTADEIDKAYSSIDSNTLNALNKAKENITTFHQMQKRTGFKIDFGDGYVGQRILPIDRAGVYIPGGRAAYPSSVMMNVIPAQIAGVEEIILCTPPSKDGKVNNVVLAAAKILGIEKIFKLGGAQAVAAMAFGTESVPRTDKIVGPGNIYVALAKKQVYGYAGIDMVAGPSEVLIIADDSAKAKYIVADLLSQAEHDPMASAILITTSRKLAEAVSMQVDKQIADLTETKENAIESIKNYGFIVIADDIDEAIEIANKIAPEHLELALSDHEKYLDSIKNAGSVFLGHYSPEPLGDYFAGPNHVLPTSGTARFSSPLGVDDFIKRSSVIYYKKEKLETVSKDIELLANLEGLKAHARSITIRFDDE
ncbi:MAG: histidinol dehydrogenase [Clostridia bacterium]|nr:histidinol dehydrogenase [Clostridia bacterium]